MLRMHKKDPQTTYLRLREGQSENSAQYKLCTSATTGSAQHKYCTSATTGSAEHEHCTHTTTGAIHYHTPSQYSVCKHSTAI